MAESLKDFQNGGARSSSGVKPQQSYKFIMEEPKEKKKNGWGGRRAGAGRPNVNKSTRTIALRIPQDVAELLDRQENRSAYIIEAIRAYNREHSEQND
nr:MAG TPA: hypothetical protein [Caudoviricetes sp.]